LNTITLYAVTVLIWGSTWLAITFQLGKVPPEVSVVYRFALAAGVLFAWALAGRRRLRFAWRTHVGFALLGLCLFSTNYVLVYLATTHVPSGLVAVVFSTIVLMNIAFGATFFGLPVEPRVVTGALVGIAGIGAVFARELAGFSLGAGGTTGLALALVATAVASLGNMVSTRLQRSGLPVLGSNAWGMAYGALLVGAWALARDLPFTFDASAAYVGSLLYLSLIGSCAAFGAYLTLLGRVGPARAGYVTVLFPAVALALSTVFENYHWSLAAVCGVTLITIGNVLVLRVPRRVPAPEPA